MKRKIWPFSNIEIILFVFIEFLILGLGMGVPIFNIIFGFFVGWYITRKFLKEIIDLKDLFGKILSTSLITSGFTFLLMLILWGTQIHFFFKENTDFENLGHPFILYDPKISFIGWLILMIFISPFLQLLLTIFSSFLTLSLLYKEK